MNVVRDALRRAGLELEHQVPGTITDVVAPPEEGRPWTVRVYGVPDESIASVNRTLAVLLVELEDEHPGLDAVGVTHAESASEQYADTVLRLFLERQLIVQRHAETNALCQAFAFIKPTVTICEKPAEALEVHWAVPAEPESAVDRIEFEPDPEIMRQRLSAFDTRTSEAA